MKEPVLSWVLVYGGATLHFVANWWEHSRKVAKIGPVEFAKQDIPGAVFAVLAATISGFILPQLGPLVGVTGPLGALTAGYMATSLGTKLTPAKKE